VVYNPSPESDATRGSRFGAFVEAIDVVPTALEALGTPAPLHRVGGTSLLSHTRAKRDCPHRDAVFPELDFSYRRARLDIGLAPDRCHATMVRTRRWKYVDWTDLRPQLFALENDPLEFHDLGLDPGYVDAGRNARQILRMDARPAPAHDRQSRTGRPKNRWAQEGGRPLRHLGRGVKQPPRARSPVVGDSEHPKR